MYLKLYNYLLFNNYIIQFFKNIKLYLRFLFLHNLFVYHYHYHYQIVKQEI